jgi:hypothetical protein
MGWLTRLGERLGRTDEERLSDEVHDWASSVPGTRRIDACPTREPVRVSGVVRRITIRPSDGTTTLEAVVTDGTGEVTAAWTGRDDIPGLTLGGRVVLEGVLGNERRTRRMVNPRFEFA